MRVRDPAPKLRSQRLALVLLVLLAVMAAAGTLVPGEKAEVLFTGIFGPEFLPAARFLGLVDTYRSPLFAGLLLLLAVNIVFCTWHRLSLFRRGAGRVGPSPGRVLRVALDVILHLSVIVVLLGGAVKGLFAEVGTGYLFEGTETDTVYDWKSEADVPLGFTLLLRERVEDHYPLQVRVGVSDSSTGEKLALLEVLEGKGVALPGSDLRISVGEYDIEGQWIEIGATSAGRRGDVRLQTVPGARTSAPFGKYGLTLVGWRRDLKKVRGRVAVLDGGEQVKEEWLAPNGRLAYGGASVFLTAWGEDEYLNPYLGIQVTRDPGALPFWIGATLLGVTLPLFILVRHRGRGDRRAGK